MTSVSFAGDGAFIDGIQKQKRNAASLGRVMRQDN